MSDLIPKTADVRDAYSAESVDSTYANRMFDLWLAKYKAKVIANTEERIIKLLEDQAGDSWPTGVAHLEISLPNLIRIIKAENK